MTRDPHDHDETHDETHEDPLGLREPDRALPAGLHRSLLAIPAAAKDAASNEGAREDDEAHRLYLYALERADRDADPADDAILGGLRPAARAVVELLVDFFRRERRPRLLPEALRGRLAELPSRPTLPRWIAEPRWAAVACWLLAFLLTFGTGDVSARLVEAAGESLSRAPAATSQVLDTGGLSSTLRSAYASTFDRVRRPVDWLANRASSRVSAWRARAEALGARAYDEIRESLPQTRETRRDAAPARDAQAEPSSSQGENDEQRHR